MVIEDYLELSSITIIYLLLSFINLETIILFLKLLQLYIF
jgi:hypothetical protein